MQQQQQQLGVGGAFDGLLKTEGLSDEALLKLSALPPPPPPPVGGKQEPGMDGGTAAVSFGGPSIPAVSQVEPEFHPDSAEMLEINTEDAIQAFREAVQRIMELEDLFTWQAPAASAASNAATLSDPHYVDPTQTLLSSRAGWMLLIVKLVVKEKGEDLEEGSLGDDDGESSAKSLRDRMADFVLDDFRAR
jgi:hypothetical protein